MGRLINCGYEDDQNRPRAEAGQGFHEQGANDPSDAPASEPSGVRGDAGSDLVDAVCRNDADEVAPSQTRQESDIPVEVYVGHALIGAAYSARMFGDNPELPPEAVKAYRWAEGEFNRIAKKEVGERDLIG